MDIDADDIDSILLPVSQQRQIDASTLTPASQEPDLPDEDDDVDDLLEQQLHEGAFHQLGDALQHLKVAPLIYSEIRLLDARPIARLPPPPSFPDKNFYEILDEFVPSIPDEVTTYHMNCAGFNNPNPKLKKVVALAVQRFVADVANDAVNYARFTAQSSNNTPRIARKEPKLMLTLDDLTQSLKEYGVSLAKPDYWAETPQPKVAADKKDKSKDRVKEKRKKGGEAAASPAPKEAKIDKVATIAPASSKEGVKKEKKRSHKNSKDKAYA